MVVYPGRKGLPWADTFPVSSLSRNNFLFSPMNAIVVMLELRHSAEATFSKVISYFLSDKLMNLFLIPIPLDLL